jgi:hypothetical protein
MAVARRDFENIQKWTLAEVATVMSEPIDKWKGEIAAAELSRRTAKAQIDSARYMLLSVCVIAATSLLSWLWPNPFHLH